MKCIPRCHEQHRSRPAHRERDTALPRISAKDSGFLVDPDGISFHLERFDDLGDNVTVRFAVTQKQIVHSGEVAAPYPLSMG